MRGRIACGDWNNGQRSAFSLWSTAATTAGYSLPGNTFVVLNVNTVGGYLAAITATSTTTIRIVQGYANS